jgi:hypothetical protein
VILSIKRSLSKFKKYAHHFYNEYIVGKSLHRLNYRGAFKELDAKYKKYVMPFHFLMVALIFIVSIVSAWLFYIFQGIFSHNSSILYDFRSSLTIWFFVGIAFMITFLRPIHKFIIRLMIGRKRANEYAHYMHLRTLENYDDSMHKLPKNTILSAFLSMIGFILLSDYSVQIDKNNIHFNDFTSILKKETYSINQIDKLFFTPANAKDSLGHFSAIDIYEIRMEDGFEWTFNDSAMEIDTSVFRFLSEKSGTKIDTLGKK